MALGVFGFGGAVGSTVVAARKENSIPSQDVSNRAAAVLVVGGVAAVVAGLAILRAFGRALGHVVALAPVVFLFGFAIYFASRRAAVPGNLAEAASPRAVLARDRRVTIYMAARVGFAFVCIPGIVVGIVIWFKAGLVPALVFGLAFPIYLGIYFSRTRTFSATQTAWPSYALVRGWLALSRRLPWSLMGFLVDAHQRGVLLQMGSVYQFRHIELQRRLATRPPASGS